MKYKIECDSPLLQYTLENFLKNFLDPKGIIITDNYDKEGIIIGKDIKKPFTKTSLIMQLQKLNVHKKPTLEEKIEELFENFKKELIKTVKEYNG